ncbi:Hypothetical predicted protein [Mytilus galloprovincialis]|uniref:Reverse transcriptase domain-containing protein n=1 Tax=Mytilus galloprovincialis TaxID=29158 RepID=A0A8B6FQ24_MYTGA|nr:Hypothetical predicted protein [Mytilus galloprovincialis]
MSDTEKLHSSPDGSSAHLTGNKDLVDTFSLFKTYLDGKFDTLYKDLAVGNENFKFATKLKPEVSVKRICSAECRAIMSIQEKKRPHPYRTAAATVSASPATMPNQHYVRKTTNSRPFGPADGGNDHLMTSVSTATSLVTGELSAPFSVQNQVPRDNKATELMIMLAFGLSSAPYLFTKCLRPIVKYWRENGVDIVLYLDDGLGMGKNKQEASECSSFVKTSLLEAGFLN